VKIQSFIELKKYIENNTTANSAQEETSFTCNDNDDDDCLRGVVNSETKFAGRKGKAILNEGETDCGER
jgi:hypothetical protein